MYFLGPNVCFFNFQISLLMQLLIKHINMIIWELFIIPVIPERSQPPLNISVIFREYKASFKSNFCSTLNLLKKKKRRGKVLKHYTLATKMVFIKWMTWKKLYHEIFCFHYSNYILSHFTPFSLSSTKQFWVVSFLDKWLVESGKRILFFWSNNYPTKQGDSSL